MNVLQILYVPMLRKGPDYAELFDEIARYCGVNRLKIHSFETINTPDTSEDDKSWEFLFLLEKDDDSVFLDSSEILAVSEMRQPQSSTDEVDGPMRRVIEECHRGSHFRERGDSYTHALMTMDGETAPRVCFKAHGLWWYMKEKI